MVSPNDVILISHGADFSYGVQMDRKAMSGVLSMKDVVKVLLDDQKHEIDSLKDYIHGGW